MTVDVPFRTAEDRRAYFVDVTQPWFAEAKKPWYETTEYRNDRERFKDPAFRALVNEYNRRNLLMNTYGITLEEYAMMFMEQDGVCAICKLPERDERNLCVDHDHETGLVRGLLCSKCNKALGGFNDQVELVEAALQYLLNHLQ